MTTLYRIATIARRTFWEVIRDRVLYLLCLFVLVMTMAVWLLPEVSTGSEDKIFLDLGIATIEIFSLAIAIFVGTGLINREIEKRTVIVLLAKPISRAEFIVGKHLGLCSVLAVLLVAMTVIYLAFLHWQGITYPVGSILTSLGYTFLMLCLITAVAIMFGTFSSAILGTLITIAIYLIGLLSRDLIAFSKLIPNPTFQRFTQTVYLLLPDLARLNLKNEAVYGVLPDASTLLLNAGYGVLYTILLLSLATLIFSQREF
ncbi:MAG: ABC transporter permease [Cyanobacteria bacterium]|nr:ABC transporter permease [Cyanobacteriota bacterium]MDW8201271.1 ABC transporter permease [Cyanobacteriota bacterium SKYGB_h_bin112]